jgi:hypothetical protein
MVKQLLSNPIGCPWAIVRILPKAQRYIVARFRNRRDADAHLRVLRRFIPTAVFETIFDPPDEEQQDDLEVKSQDLGN